MVKVEWNRYSKSYLTFQFILYELTFDNMGTSNQSHEFSAGCIIFHKFSQNCPEFCGKKRCIKNEFISAWKFSRNEGNCGKIRRKKLKHGNEFISMRKFLRNEIN